MYHLRMVLTLLTTLWDVFHLSDSFQGCEQIPTGVLESLEDECKRIEEAEEGEIGETEGSLTQRGLTAWQLFIFLLLKFSYSVCHIFINTCLLYKSTRKTRFMQHFV